ILDFLGLGDELDALDGSFTADVGIPNMRMAADLALAAQNGRVEVSLVSVNAIGLGGFNSDFDLDLGIPQAFYDFGFGLGGLAVDTLELAIEGIRYIIVEAFLKTLMPLIANLIIEPLINEIQIQLAANFSNGSLVSLFTEVDTIDVFNSDTSLLLGLNARVAAEDVNLSSINLDLATEISGGFTVLDGTSLNLNLDRQGESGDVNVGSVNVDLTTEITGTLYVLDMEDIPSSLALPPLGLAPQVLGFRYSKDPAQVPNNNGDIEVNISTNMVNQALLALHEGGLLGIDLAMLNNFERITFVPLEDANTKISLGPSTPPELLVKGGVHPVIVLVINDYNIHYQRKLKDGSWGKGLNFFFSAELPIQLGEQGEAGLKLGLLSPQLNIQLRDVGPFTVGISTPERRKMLAAGVLPKLLENIEVKLNLFFAGQPPVGFTIEVDSLSAQGTPGGHIGASVNTGPL
ncbi:MAG: hypothetical protein JKY01_10925, partial [Pseudomonadales bacterium]|nr:hypothetical protein [Pseudomonadales bacterium]